MVRPVQPDLKGSPVQPGPQGRKELLALMARTERLELPAPLVRQAWTGKVTTSPAKHTPRMPLSSIRDQLTFHPLARPRVKFREAVRHGNCWHKKAPMGRPGLLV